MATQKAAQWAASLSYSSLPPDALQAAIRSFYNWVGCTVGGSNHPAASIARNSLSRFFGSPTSTLLGTNGPQVDAQHAALINGIASHVHDYDDTHLETIIHPTGPVAAALLSFAQSLDRPVSGQEFLTALAAGIELECKAGLAVWPSHYDVGWHITSTTGSIGAAVAVSRLLDLSPEKTAHAIGIAATQVTGLREMFGSHTKSFHPGRAAQNGLLAAILAADGYTSSLQALEAKRGWVKVVSNDDKLTQEIDSLNSNGKWELAKNAFKPFPCGIVIHPVIDGCVWLHGELQRRGLRLQDIKRVHVTVHPLVLELTGKTKPKDGLEAKFSVYHGGAIGLIHGKATPAEYEDAVVTNSETIEVRDKFVATAAENIRADECRILVEFEAPGVQVEKHVHHAVGSIDAPMTDSQLTEKFIDQCSSILGPEQAKIISDWCWNLETKDDIRQIGQFL
ncbi:MmgE/PrpD family protein [Aspergillus vadensis CBS 113365]|uniref:MmgE/PrpD family protein n=1 Tax=Aspergillus vadensis (strain CBS 113365 / IMI 142717 / IBT 24658) TaxID=1448311 RepID=A0A319CKC1_ASPVC|nr:MmgE/PrpD family protein [Aspergillus vadensis CBS 113365]PYH68762.1 MmgE/PrpD family protein [Aspergillus vadensis CBS 113365]